MNQFKFYKFNMRFSVVEEPKQHSHKEGVARLAEVDSRLAGVDIRFVEHLVAFPQI